MSVRFFNGVIADTPTVDTDLIRVSVPDLVSMRRRVYGPMSFRPQVRGAGTTYLPERGDFAFIAIDTEGHPWILAWAES